MQFVDVARLDAELNQQTLDAHVELAAQAELAQHLAESASWNLLRIAEQAVRSRNYPRWPHADHCRFGLRSPKTGALRLSVVDQGRGFECGRSQTETQHFGLNSMAHRAQLLGARLEVKSAPGCGCSASCTLPVTQS